MHLAYTSKLRKLKVRNKLSLRPNIVQLQLYTAVLSKSPLAGNSFECFEDMNLRP